MASTAFGPWIANSEYSSEILRISTPKLLCDEIQFQSLSIFEALTTSKYCSSFMRYTIKSSTIPPSLFGKQEYCARPISNTEASLEVTF